MTVLVKADGRHLVLQFPYDPHSVALVKAIPGRKYDPKAKEWKTPISKFHELEIRKAFPSAVWTEKTLSVIKNKVQVRVPVAGLTSLDIPKSVDGVYNRFYPEKKIKDFQLIAAAFAKKNKRVLIADSIGAGKTLEAVLSSRFCGAKKNIIVCPAYLIPTWKREVEEWTGVKPLVINAESYKELSEMTSDNFDAFAEKREFSVIGYEILCRFELASKIKWDCLIIDECHYIKESSSLRSIACNSIDSEYAFPITGTPVENKPMEFWNVLNLLTEGEFGTKTHFGDRYADGKLEEIFTGMKCGACGIKRKLNPPCWSCGSGSVGVREFRKIKTYKGASNLKELHNRLDGVMIRRTREEILGDLPEFSRTDRIIAMTQDESKQYDVMMTDLYDYLIKYTEKNEDDAKRSSFNETLTRVGYSKHFLSKVKIDAAVEDAMQIIQSGQSVVIFTTYLDVVDEISKKLIVEIKALDTRADHKIFIHTGGVNANEREANEKEFQRSSGSVFIATTDSAYLGLTLTAANYMIFLDLPWTPTKLAQAEGRILRTGQKRPVTYIRYFCENTYDAQILEILIEKQKIIDLIMEGKETDESADMVGPIIRRLIAQAKKAKELKNGRNH